MAKWLTYAADSILKADLLAIQLNQNIDPVILCRDQKFETFRDYWAHYAVNWNVGKNQHIFPPNLGIIQW